MSPTYYFQASRFSLHCSSDEWLSLLSGIETSLLSNSCMLTGCHVCFIWESSFNFRSWAWALFIIATVCMSIGVGKHMVLSVLEREVCCDVAIDFFCGFPSLEWMASGVVLCVFCLSVCLSGRETAGLWKERGARGTWYCHKFVAVRCSITNYLPLELYTDFIYSFVWFLWWLSCSYILSEAQVLCNNKNDLPSLLSISLSFDLSSWCRI